VNGEEELRLMEGVDVVAAAAAVLEFP